MLERGGSFDPDDCIFHPSYGLQVAASRKLSFNLWAGRGAKNPSERFEDSGEEDERITDHNLQLAITRPDLEYKSL